MTFRLNIAINITGPSYQDRSKPLSSQKTKNFYHQVVEEGKENYVLHSFPGLKFKGASSTGKKNRGVTQMAEVGYRVTDNVLESFTPDGVHTVRGNVPGSDICIFANDGFNLMIVAGGGVVLKYDGTTVTTVADTNIVGSIAVTYLNSQMIYTNPPLFVVADPGIPDKASGLNAAQAESQPDALLRAYAFDQSVNMIGLRSNEPWWNDGEGQPPFSRIDGQIIEVGCPAINSIAHTDEFLYWLGDDDAVYQTIGGSKNRISSPAISHAIAGYTKVSDAIAYTFTFEGMNFYAIHFPSGDQTWCLNESLGLQGWFELSSGTNDGIYQGQSLVNVYGKNFVTDVDNGNLYELDIDTFTNNGEIIQRQRITSSITGKLLGAPGREVEISRLQIIMETGVGLTTGQGEDPKIIIDVSYDGGNTWNAEGFVRIGRLGENTLQVELFLFATFHDARFRITTSDAVPFEIYSGVVDLRLTGA